jgi:hypothetical protein
VRSVEADDWSLELIKRVTAAEAAGSGAQLAVCYWTCRAVPIRRGPEEPLVLAFIGCRGPTRGIDVVWTQDSKSGKLGSLGTTKETCFEHFTQCFLND